jgi:hypothetical protein
VQGSWKKTQCDKWVCCLGVKQSRALQKQRGINGSALTVSVFGPKKPTSRMEVGI